MNVGLRAHRSASLRVAMAEGLPEEIQPLTREILSVHAGNARKGHATALMHTVCAEADNYWVTLLLQPRKFDDGMDDEKLVAWYERFGFVRIQDEPVVLMVRSPQLPKIERVH